jgi:predicted acetyltransferase
MIEVAAAKFSERGVLDNLFQLYVHDFSEQWVGTPRGEVGVDGRFEPYPWLDSYWRSSQRMLSQLR